MTEKEYMTEKEFKRKVTYALLQAPLLYEREGAYAQWQNCVGELAKLGLCNELEILEEYPESCWIKK